MEQEEPHRLVRGEPSVHPREFLHASGLSLDELEVLLAEDLLAGGYSDAGELKAVFLDRLPTMEQMRALGMSPRSDFVEGLRAAGGQED